MSPYSLSIATTLLIFTSGSAVHAASPAVNVDVQISAGLFHAGYPMQGPQQACRGMVDLESLRQHGNWGWFHELGHESQRRPDKKWGWDIATLLKSYSDDQDSDPTLLPTNNAEERDQLCIRLSKIVQRNLHPFFAELWGIEISDSARNQVASLAEWMPPVFAPES